MSGSDDLRFQMMGIGAPPLGAPAPEAKKEGKSDTGYPTFEMFLTDKAKFDALIASAQKNMAELEGLADKGATAQVKSEARKALRAYDHTLDFLRRGLELTTQFIKQRQAKAKAAKAAGKR